MRLIEAGKSPVERLSVLRAEHVEAKCLSRPGVAVPFFKQLVDSDEVAEALRHLLPLDLKEAVMHPDLRHDFGVMGAAGLRDLVLMMREDEVDAAAVDVEHVA